MAFNRQRDITISEQPKMIFHRLQHLLGLNSGHIETFCRGDGELMVGYRCKCGKLQDVDVCHGWRERQALPENQTKPRVLHVRYRSCEDWIWVCRTLKDDEGVRIYELEEAKKVGNAIWVVLEVLGNSGRQLL